MEEIQRFTGLSKEQIEDAIKKREFKDAVKKSSETAEPKVVKKKKGNRRGTSDYVGSCITSQGYSGKTKYTVGEGCLTILRLLYFYTEDILSFPLLVCFP
jgi:hypothetical protein